MQIFVSSDDPKKNQINSFFQFWLEFVLWLSLASIFILPLPRVFKIIIFLVAIGFGTRSWLQWNGWFTEQALSDGARSKLALEACVQYSKEEAKISDRSQLKRLFCASKALTDLSSIADLTGLEELYLTRNRLTSLAPLNPLVNVRVLALSFNPSLSSLQGIEKLTKLQKLLLRETAVFDLSPVEHLNQLVEVDLYRTKITSLKSLQNHSLLEAVHTSTKTLFSLKGMSDKMALKRITFYHSQVRDISPLFDSKNLKIVGIPSAGLVPCEQVSQLRALLVPEAKIYAKHCE